MCSQPVHTFRKTDPKGFRVLSLHGLLASHIQNPVSEHHAAGDPDIVDVADGRDAADWVEMVLMLKLLVAEDKKTLEGE